LLRPVIVLLDTPARPIILVPPCSSTVLSALPSVVWMVPVVLMLVVPVSVVTPVTVKFPVLTMFPVLVMP